jgi:hypothetical protein
MSDNQQISERKYAASLARKYFSGEISKDEILSSFPDYEKDFKMRLLYNRIIQKSKMIYDTKANNYNIYYTFL